MQQKLYKMNVYKVTDGNFTVVGSVCADNPVEAVEMLTGREVKRCEITTYPLRFKTKIKAVYKTKAFDIFEIHSFLINAPKNTLWQRIKDKFL